MKYLETTKERQDREAVIEAQQATLSRAWQALSDDDDRIHLEALQGALTDEWLELRKEKEWIVTFENGGWNTIMGGDQEIAKDRAVAEYSFAEIKSLFLRSENPQLYKNLMLNFN